LGENWPNLVTLVGSEMMIFETGIHTSMNDCETQRKSVSPFFSPKMFKDSSKVRDTIRVKVLSDDFSSGGTTRVARFFLLQLTKVVKYRPNCHKMWQMEVKYTKWF
jgi:hypothetical protein